MSRWRCERGQSAVEVVAALPVAVAVVGGAVLALAAGGAGELADHAAHAGAVALVQGTDPARAARAAVPGWARSGVRVDVRGRVVRVRLRPPVPGRLGELLGASAKADAGPGPRP